MSSAPSKRRADIEGLRAVAVALVVLYHAGATFVSGGFVGVDVFFVISGFLITNLLVEEADRFDQVSLRNFWARRMRRLLPMSLLVTIVTVAAGVFMLEPGRVRELTTVALGAIGFSTNIVLYYTSSEYLLGVTPPSPLQHYWSLAVEEQFYLVWPLIIFAVIHYSKKQWRQLLGRIVVALLLASLVTGILLTPSNPGGAYYLPQARVWEILVGAALALYGSRVREIPEHLRAGAGWVGIAAIVGSAVGFSNATPFPGYAALLPVLGALLVLVAGGTRFGPEVVLRARPLQHVGAWSYSLYLWHWPIFVLVEAKFGTPTFLGWVLLIAFTTALSGLTYTAIEHPVRVNDWLSLRSMRSVTVGLGSVLAVFSLTAVLFGVAPRIDARAQRFVVPEELAELDANGEPVVSLPAPEPKDVNVLLLGDSTMASLRWFEDGQQSLEGFNYKLDVESCRKIALQSCEGREKRVPESAVSVLENYNEPVDVVVVMAGYHSWTTEFEAEVRELADMARYRGAKLVMLSLKESLKFPAPGSRGERSVYSDFNKQLREIAESGDYPQLTIANWNLFSYSSPDWFEKDGIHLKLEGTLALGWYLSRIVASVVDNPCPEDGAYPCSIPAIADSEINWMKKYDVRDTNRHCYEDGKNRTLACTTNRRV